MVDIRIEFHGNLLRSLAIQQNDTQTLPSGLKKRHLALALCSPALASSVDKAWLVIGLMACPATHTGANGRDNMEYFILVWGGVRSLQHRQELVI